MQPVIAAWRPLSANATSYGLIMLGVYGAAVWLCLRAASQGRHHPDYPTGPLRRERRAWLAIAGLLAALAIYRQLDLAELLTGLGRGIALHGKWYGHRRPMQLAMVVVVATVIIALAAALFWSMSAYHPLVLAALAACTALLLLLGINVLSLHAIDRFFRRGYHRVDIYNLVEAGSLAAILAAAHEYRRHIAAAGRR